MRIGFMGKGGSGKTTLAAACAAYFMDRGRYVMALDGDMNVHLASVFGASALPLADSADAVVAYLEPDRGYPVIGTTPPSLSSRFIRPCADDNFLNIFGTPLKNGHLISAGTYGGDDIGSNCYHGKLSLLEIILHRLLDRSDDIVIADSTAGVDALGTSLFSSYDIIIFVVEPTLKGVRVFEDFKRISASFGAKVYALVNKLVNEADKEFISSHLSAEDIIAYVEQSELVREIERGDFSKISDFASSNEDVFLKIQQAASEKQRDWDDYYQKLCLLYEKNCEKWYNIYYGQRLNAAIDPSFSYQRALDAYEL